jgi:hypothetical protein
MLRIAPSARAIIAAEGVLFPSAVCISVDTDHPRADAARRTLPNWTIAAFARGVATD